MLNYNSEETQSSVLKFEQMLKTNLIYFFDAQEFEDIIIHYLGFGENQLAKKALKLALEQHPSSYELMLLQSEIFILEEKYELALEVLEYVEKINPFDEEIALQKASISSKKGDHKTSINQLHQALSISEDPLEIWNLLGMEHLLAEEFKESGPYFNSLCLGSVQTKMLEQVFPGYKAQVKPKDMAKFIFDFANNGTKYFNGKVIPVSLSNP